MAGKVSSVSGRLNDSVWHLSDGGSTVAGPLQVPFPFPPGFFSFLSARSPLPSLSGWTKLMKPWSKRVESQSPLVG